MGPLLQFDCFFVMTAAAEISVPGGVPFYLDPLVPITSSLRLGIKTDGYILLSPMDRSRLSPRGFLYLPLRALALVLHTSLMIADASSDFRSRFCS